MPRKTPIQYRQGTAAEWTAANPTLLAGEPGFETDTGKAKIGDGATAWTSLAYAAVPISAFAATLLDDTSAAAMRTTLGLGTGATLASDTDGTLAANSDSNVATQKATKTYADTKIGKSLVTAKGSMIAATAASTPAEVAVGSNGKVMKADSTQSTGVAWDYAVPAAGNPAGGATTYYTQPGFMHANTGTRALSANVRYFYQLYNPTPIVVDQIIWEQTGAAAAGKLIRIGLLLADEWWQPSSVLIDSGSQAADGANGVKAYTLSQATAVPAGRLLAVVHSDGAPQCRETVGGVFGAANSTSLGTTPIIQGFTVSTAYAAFDTTAWTSSLGSGAACRCAVWLRLSDPTG